VLREVLAGVGDEAGERPHAARLEHLDGLRGLAALWVVLFHVGNPAAAAAVPRWIYVPLVDWGHLGVPAFFTLSGFVIARSLRNRPVTGGVAGRFMVRRLLRLTPPYYVSVAAVLVVAGLSSLIEGEPFRSEGPITIGRLLAHLVYLQEAIGLGGFQPLYWTLCFEVAFYVVLITMLRAAERIDVRLRAAGRRTRGLHLVLVPTVAVAVIAAPGDLGGLPVPTALNFLPTFICFLVGAVIWWVVDGRLPWWPAAVLVELLVVIGVMRWEGFHLISAVTALFLASESPWLHRPFTGRVAGFLGRTAYSTYLIHPPVLGIVAFAVQETLGRETTAGGLAEIALGVVGSVVAGWLLWRTVERRAVLWSTRAGRVGWREWRRVFATPTPQGYGDDEREEREMAGYHDDKDAVLARLRRIEGQVRGLQRMVDDEAYCIDVITQVASVTRALQAVSVLLLNDHLHHCVADAVAEGGPDAPDKVDEAMKAVERLIRS